MDITPLNFHDLVLIIIFLFIKIFQLLCDLLHKMWICGNVFTNMVLFWGQGECIVESIVYSHSLLCMFLITSKDLFWNIIICASPLNLRVPEKLLFIIAYTHWKELSRIVHILEISLDDLICSVCENATRIIISVSLLNDRREYKIILFVNLSFLHSFLNNLY